MMAITNFGQSYNRIALSAVLKGRQEMMVEAMAGWLKAYVPILGVGAAVLAVETATLETKDLIGSAAPQIIGVLIVVAIFMKDRKEDRRTLVAAVNRLAGIVMRLDNSLHQNSKPYRAETIIRVETGQEVRDDEIFNENTA